MDGLSRERLESSDRERTFVVLVSGAELEFKAGIGIAEVNTSLAQAGGRRIAAAATGIVVMKDVARVVGPHGYDVFSNAFGSSTTINTWPVLKPGSTSSDLHATMSPRRAFARGSTARQPSAPSTGNVLNQS